MLWLKQVEAELSSSQMIQQINKRNMLLTESTDFIKLIINFDTNYFFLSQGLMGEVPMKK